MKNVLIVPSNTDLNRGDQSLTWASIDIAKDVFGEDINIFLYKTRGKLAENTKTNHQTEKLGYPLLVRILSHPRRDDSRNDVNFSKLTYLKWGWRAITDLFITLMLLSKSIVFNRLAILSLSEEQKKSLKIFKTLDALFVKGGGFLHSYGSMADPYIMYFQLFDVFLAKRYNIPVYILPNSIGPLKNRLAEMIVFKALKYARVIFVRESKSYDFLTEKNIKVIKSPDLGFYLNPSFQDFSDYLKGKKIPVGLKKIMGITLRPYRFDGANNAEDLYRKYIEEFESFIERVTQDNITIVLVAHTIGPSAHEDDRIPLQEIYRKFEDNENVIYLDDKNLNSRDLEKIYSYFDLMIGTRFHSVIFSLNVFTPAIAIAYGGNKAVGIMQDIQLPEYVLPIENPEALIMYELMYKSFQEKDLYVDKIKQYKILLEKERDNLIKVISSTL